MSIEGKKNIIAHLAGKEADPCTQYGALCWRKAENGKPEVLLITSRETGRWVIPKGWAMKGKGPSEAAAQEAYEEAGVEGRVSDACAGLYSYTKLFGPDRTGEVPCVVSVYPIQVRRLLRNFPEVDERRRKWFSPKKAAQKVDEPELQALLRAFSPARLKDMKDGAGKKAG